MAGKPQPIVVGIGELLWDMLPEGKRAGGAPINFVYHAVKMGAKGYAISAVGDDIFGREIIQELEDNQISHCIALTPYSTGRVEVSLQNGIPSYQIIENVAWDYLPVTASATDIIRKADAVCFGTLALRNKQSRNSIKTMLSFAPPKAIKFFDVNLRGKYYSPKLIKDLLKIATVFKLNEDEIVIIRDLFGLSGSNEAICRTLLSQYHLDYLIFTAGEKYSAIYTPTAVSVLPTPQVVVVDTVGAGDAFSGAFVYGILTGKDIYQAHADAVRVSAYVCTCSGAWPQYTHLPKG